MFGRQALTAHELDALLPADDLVRAQGWRHFDDLVAPFERRNGPVLCRRLTDAELEFGFLATQAHCNVLGTVDGGWLATFADTCMSNAVVHAVQQSQGHSDLPALVTQTLHVDYTKPVKPGQWVTSRPSVTAMTKTTAFVTTVIKSSQATVASASAVFRLHQITAKL